MERLERHHIQAGAGYVSQTKPLVLSAALGTCVGVALFDEKNRVGGLIHLLLPEPISTDSVLFPEKYATTALPPFIQNLLNSGAALEHLKAVIAGGAFVGPLSNQDLKLDIGGKIAEVTIKILRAAGIPIIKSETGGFFTCRLELNLLSFETDIKPVLLNEPSSYESAPLPSLSQISEAMDRVSPIPQVALKILRLVDEDDYDLSVIASEVKKDQVISAKTIQLANSALFSRGRPVETLDDALFILGQDLLVQVVVSAAVRSFFTLKAGGYSLCKGGLFYHSLGSAQLAATIASLTGIVSVPLAYTAGLLHDIGKVVLDQFVMEAYPLFYRNLTQEGKSAIQTEEELFGINHTQIGFLLANRWNFPSSLMHVIKFHHAPEKGKAFNELIHVLHVADLLITRFQPGLEMERMHGHHLTGRLLAIGLSLKDLPRIVDAIPPVVFQYASSQDLEVA